MPNTKTVLTIQSMKYPRIISCFVTSGIEMVVSSLQIIIIYMIILLKDAPSSQHKLQTPVDAEAPYILSMA